MAITDNYAPDKSSGNGVTAAFSGNWNVLAAAYFRLYWEDKTTGVQTLKTLGTHYTLAFTSSGYTATHDPAYIPPSTVWVVRAREITKDQSAPYKTSTGFQGAVIEQSLDKLTAMDQEVQEQIDRTPKLPLGSTISPTMEAPVAKKALLWNDAGTGLINSVDDFDDIVADATAQAVIATAQAVIATTQAGLAATARAAADADVVLTHADVVLTHADVVLTHADVVLTHADVVSTHADVLLTAADVISAAASASTATTQAGTATTQAGIATAKAVLTAADAVATAADRVQTGLDRTAAAASATAASGSATAAAASAATLQGTSTTSLAIAVASKSFTTQAGKQFTAGAWLLATSDADPTNYMHGQVTSYSGTALVLNVTNIGGSGTHADWTITVAGTRGATGATGAAGSVPIANGAGTVDAITADFSPDLTLADNLIVAVVSTGVNTVTNPTLNTDGTGALTIKGRGNAALQAGDTGAAGYTMLLRYEATGTYWELINPKKPLNADVIGSVITGYSSGAGTVASTDTILQAINKLNGNIGALGSSEVVLLATAAPSSAASILFTSLISSTYSSYIMVFEDLLFSGTGTLNLDASTDNGATYAASGNAQRWEIQVGSTSAPNYASQSFTASAILPSLATPNITGIAQFTAKTRLMWESTLSPNNSVNVYKFYQVSTAAVNALKLSPSSGNFTSGKVYLYGVKNT